MWTDSTYALCGCQREYFMDSLKLLNAGVIKAGSISALAREIGVTQQVMSIFVHGKSPLPPYRAAQIAKYLGMNELEAAVQTLAEKAVGPERDYWIAQKKTVAGFAAVWFLAVTSLFSAVSFNSSVLGEASHNIQCFQKGVFRRRRSSGQRKVCRLIGLCVRLTLPIAAGLRPTPRGIHELRQ